MSCDYNERFNPNDPLSSDYEEPTMTTNLYTTIFNTNININIKIKLFIKNNA